MNKRNSYHLDLLEWDLITGTLEIPMLWGEQVYGIKRFIGFNQVLSFRGDPSKIGVHFYLDDYQFERVWNTPERYLKTLEPFGCIAAPDFSMFIGMPKAMMIWNHYRKMAIAQFWQNQGLKVIPTLNWAKRDSWEFCFDGLPELSCVSVSSLGVMKSAAAKRIWSEGMNEAVRRLKPRQILAYGEPLPFDPAGAEVVWFRSEHLDRMRKIRRKGNGPRTNFLVQNPRLVYYVANMMGIPKSEWEDFFQETILASLQTKDDYCEEKGKLESWCRKFVELTALNYKRKLEK